nr:MAG TPA: hypothetical protein [Caudoviricetes sp.]
MFCLRGVVIPLNVVEGYENLSTIWKENPVKQILTVVKYNGKTACLLFNMQIG